MSEDPRHALPALGTAGHLLVALDFDGTLAPLVDNPDDARMSTAARSALNALGVDAGTTIALVSGRGAHNLISVSSPQKNWWVVGSHGIEVIAPGSEIEEGLTAQMMTDREALWGEFETVAEQFSGVWVEKKPWGAAFHTRGVDSAIEHNAHSQLREAISAWGDTLTTRTGHGILESSLGRATKGDGIERVRESVSPDITVFIGDDVTDEDGFAALGPKDVGIKVGDGPTGANYRLGTPDDVAEFLSELASHRTR